jgi:hypothetical protein
MTAHFTDIKNPRYSNADGTSIDVIVSIEGIGNNMPYTVEPNSATSLGTSRRSRFPMSTMLR